jgi:hypothetical protein
MRTMPTLLLALLLCAGCGREEPAAGPGPVEPLARPEVAAEPVEPPAVTESVDRAMADAFREAVARELDELDRRQRELARAVVEHPEGTESASALIEEVGLALGAARAELETAAAAGPEELMAQQAAMTARLGDVTTMLEDAAGMVEAARSAPAILPDIGEAPKPPSGAPKSPK